MGSEASVAPEMGVAQVFAAASRPLHLETPFSIFWLRPCSTHEIKNKGQDYVASTST